jgi:hypothetical protein
MEKQWSSHFRRSSHAHVENIKSEKTIMSLVMLFTTTLSRCSLRFSASEEHLMVPSMSSVCLVFHHSCNNDTGSHCWNNHLGS